MHSLVQKNSLCPGRATQWDDIPKLFEDLLHTVHYSWAIDLEENMPPLLRPTNNVGSYRTAKWREMTELSCGSCLATLWTSCYGENAYDLLSDGIA